MPCPGMHASEPTKPFRSSSWLDGCRNGTFDVTAEVWAGGSLSWESVGSWVVGWSVGDRESVFDMNNESLITKFVITGFSAI